MKTKNFMNYIKLKKYGVAENLIIQKAEIPKINDYEVLIEVYASGVNRPDILQRKGLYAPPKGASKILGLEVSGKIKKIGKKVKNFKLDINEIHKINLKGVYACIHLASIANDPMGDLDQTFSWETSALGTMVLMEHLKKK